MIRSGERDLIAGRDKDCGARQDRGDKTRKNRRKLQPMEIRGLRAVIES